ncbi:MAG: hypothetical protein Q9P14_17060 [candidate division KSB1 bacterium]|nr:hypothetical protein [candidate division KSB1 bacterium]MDQ7066360.1 hypothetical protein [candidate division KSB1 bacterium]
MDHLREDITEGKDVVVPLTALELADAGHIREAIEALKKANALLPDSGRDLLIAALESKLAKPEAQPKSKWAILSNGVFLVGTFAASAVTLAFLLIGFSPLTRARLYTIMGRPLAAARVYERRLEKNPRRLNVYPLLASIYLMLNRQDEKALQVYKKVIQLDLPSPHLSQMNSIITNRFLGDQKLNGEDGIEFLEWALQEELLKKKQF